MANVEVMLKRRNGTSISSEQASVFANAFYTALESCGLIRMTNAQYPGQCGELTVSTPVPEGKTFLALPSKNFELTDLGIFRVYKHPHLPIWIKAKLVLRSYNNQALTKPRSAVDMVLTVATGLQNGEFTGTPLTVDNMTGSYIDYPHGSFDSSMEHRVRFHCGHKSFWIYSPATLLTSNNPLGFYTGENYGADGCFSHFNFALLASTTNDKLATVLYSPPVVMSDSTQTDYNPPNYVEDQFTIRAAEINLNTGMIMPKTNKYFIAPFEYGVPSDKSGVIVSAGYKTIDGQPEKFPLGFITRSVIAEFGEYNLNLDGLGEKTYMAASSFGPVMPVRRYGDLPSNCIICLLPYGEL